MSPTDEKKHEPYLNLWDRLDRYAPRDKSDLSDEVLSKIRVVSCGKIGQFTVWAVDGLSVRNLVDIDFTTGGNPARYRYVPPNEIWVERLFTPSDFACVVLHESVEYLAMRHQGLSYSEAHDQANIHEWSMRQAILRGDFKVRTFEEAVVEAGRFLQPSLLVFRIVARYAGTVIPFKPKPGVPTVTIGGRKYNLSTDGGPLGDLADEDEPYSGGARLIRLPTSNKWKFLWVYDTTKQIVAMFRVTDGNEKAYGPSRSMTQEIIRLDRKGQLNRVTTSEFHKVEQEMRRLEAENLKALQESIEANKDDFQRQVDVLTREFYEKRIKPLVERAVADAKAGVTPIGFKAHPHSDPMQQMVSHNIGTTLSREFTLAKIEAYLKSKGLDLDSPYVDNQAAYWAQQDVMDSVFDSYR